MSIIDTILKVLSNISCTVKFNKGQDEPGIEMTEPIKTSILKPIDEQRVSSVETQPGSRARRYNTIVRK